MSEHLSAQQIRRFRERAMSSAELIAADGHLAVCQVCRKQLDEAAILQSTVVFLRDELHPESISPGDHLAYEELAAYVDDRADEVDREIAESHLEICSQCRKEAHDLRAFRAEISTYPGKEYAPASRASLRKKVAALLSRPALRTPLQLAATAALAVLCVLIATLPLRKQVEDLTARLSEIQQTNETLRAQASTVTELQARVAELQQSQIELLNASPQIALALYDGSGFVTLDKQGKLAGLESMPEPLQQAISATLTDGRIEVPRDVRELMGKTGVLLGGGSDGVPFSLISPVGIIVESDRPMLRWQALAGATGYIGTVSDSNFNEVAKSSQLTETQWALPRSLERGQVYSWQVAAIKDGGQIKSPTPPAPDARFKVLEQARLEEIERGRKAYPDSHLTLGVLYAKAGLLDAAEREFKALAVANPKAPIAQKLLQSVRRLKQAR